MCLSDLYVYSLNQYYTPEYNIGLMAITNYSFLESQEHVSSSLNWLHHIF